MQSRAFRLFRVVPLLPLLLCTAGGSHAVNTLENGSPELHRSASPVVSLDPNRQAHPESSLVDFSRLLDAPAGKHGFMTTRPDGHFYFADGTRARFWGINIAAESVFQSHKTIDDTVGVLARAGINLVRIHEIDEVGGVIDYTWSDSQHLSAARLHTLDYWVKRCRDAGIYVYLDLLDYRTFRRADGVPNAAALGRAAKPYAIFDRRLIELQEEYARRLLSSHINVYTGLSYAKDPAVCMLELFDESGLFIKRTMLHSLVAPYRAELVRKWNQWLKDRYGNSANLYASWTNGLGQHALRHGEYIERGSVKLPDLLLNADWDRPYDANDSPARLNDEALFAYSMEVRYCSEMKHYLRGIGVRVPICAVGSPDVLADTKALSNTLDFVGNNFYWDHPTFRPGSNWKLPSYFNSRNPIQSVDEYSFAPTTAFFKVKGKPLVIREWNYCWPNRYRDAGMLEAAVYACLQDVDAMILFTYDTNPHLKTLSYFDVSHDPDRWASVGPLASVFLEQMVKPARSLVEVGYSRADVFHYHGYLSSVYTAGWTSRVENVFFDQVFPKDNATLVVASGRSASASYPIDHAIIRTNDRYDHITGGVSSNTSPARSGYAVPVDSWPATTYAFAGDLMPADARIVGDPGLRFRTAAVKTSGFRPIGVSVDGSHCLGFYDPVRDNYVFQDMDEVLALRATLQALHRSTGIDSGSDSVHRDLFVSDTGELVRDSATGVLEVNTPRFQAIAGNIRPDTNTGPNGLRVHSQTDEGTIIALSLDGKPVGDSQRLLLQMLTGASNTGEVTHWPPGGSGRIELASAGTGPVRTMGEPVLDPTEIWLGGERVASVFLHGGVWMMLQDGGQCTFYCDTPQVRVQVAHFSRSRVLEPAADPSDPGPVAVVSAPAVGGGFFTPESGALVSLERG